jgi:hypothetical protein
MSTISTGMVKQNFQIFNFKAKFTLADETF